MDFLVNRDDAGPLRTALRERLGESAQVTANVLAPLRPLLDLADDVVVRPLVGVRRTHLAHGAWVDVMTGFVGGADLLYTARAQAQRLGGSHTQRDLIDQTLIAACGRGSRKALGRAMLNERMLAKAPTPLTRHWLEALDDHGQQARQ